MVDPKATLTFTPFAAYPAGWLILRSGTLYAAKVAFTAGAAFDAADWNAIVPPASAYDPAGAADTAQAAAIAVSAQRASNLSDLASAATARSNLGLGSASTHPATDFDTAGAAAAAQAASTPLATLLSGVPKVANATANGNLASNTLVPADATAGTIALALPTGAAVGAVIVVEKIDSTANLVNVTGTIRGTGSSTLAIRLQFESIVFVSEGSNSWRPMAGHKTLSSLDARYDATGAASTAQTAAIAVSAQRASNLSDLANAATARTNLGLGSAATQATTAFDAAGAAAALRPPGLVTPLDTRLLSGAAAPTSLQLVACRVIVPKTGVLHDFALFVKVHSGNVHAGIYDTGDALAGSRSLLWDSGSVALAADSVWQVIGDPSLSVTAGQQLDFVFQADNVTATLGCFLAYTGPQNVLPTSFWPVAGGASPKPSWSKTLGSYGALPATVTEATCGTLNNTFMMIARVV